MGCISGAQVQTIEQLTIGGLKVLKQSKLAEGAYGDIWKCKEASSDVLFALKQIRLQSKDLRQMYEKEVHILQKMREERVKRSIGLKASVVQHRGADSMGLILLEFGTITLLDEVSSKKLSQHQIVIILRDVSLGLEEIHALQIFHLDLKPENIILVRDQYKLCDFGSAITKEVDYDKLPRKEKNSFNEYLEANSTLSYRSPEMIEPTGKIIGSASDIWMLGCVAYLLTFRKHPFEGEGKLAIISGSVPYPADGFLSQKIKQMLSIDPKARPSAKDLAIQLNAWLSTKGQ